jgi:hypothetical protein
MRETRITLPELVLVAGTRAALGAGLGLLLADRFSEDERRAVGWTLFLVGALSTVPLALDIFWHRLSAPTESPEQTTSRRRFEPNEPPSQERALARS